MQTHHDTSARTGSSPPFQEGACLVCGTSVPSLGVLENLEEQLRVLGWHSWLSHTSTTHRRHLSLLRLCPQCVADPMFVATRILESHGADQLEEWIRSVEQEMG
jgi:hypothetical protein